MKSVQPTMRPLLELAIDVFPPVIFGREGGGESRLLPFQRGTFSGAELSGKVLPGGTDWQDVFSDGTVEIRARYLLETDQGERIEVQSNGVRTASPEVLARLSAGELLPGSEYYFRTAIRMRTAAPRLTRLNGVLAFSVGERRPSGVALSVFELL